MSEVKTDDTILVDGLDDALLGYDTKRRAIYSVIKIIQIFMERDGMDENTAREWFDYNLEQAYLGEYTRIYLYDA